ncbi:MAG: hypothetical protein A3G35_03225 [candidate division NC10 bacterium RIFCSPLOWO2_12_FULL_66_18]|nr:MAG: hypothetical protein A3H29_13830 [Acidobacteria bacterium RIFCSPLOWO2_02_FULL_67_21]OGB96670.1 MAG: hypothetical protein A3G35_03225 [candidate division NC10 bacterium RIFCSPLOWO2_12_FULL_66_18]
MRWAGFGTLVALATAVACSSTGASPSEETGDSPAASSGAPPVQTLTLTYDRPIVGAAVRATTAGLPAGKTVELLWATVSGGWVIEDSYHFRGKKYVDSSMPLGQFAVDATGRLDARFTIPEDYGGMHDVVARIDGVPVAQNGVEVTQTFEMTPSSGPIGTPIELRVTGLGWRTMESTWVVNWDNNLVGFVSAAGTGGSAVARFRAAGPAGSHVVKVLTGYQGQGYLNYEQSPVAHLPRPQFTFETTPGQAAMPPVYAEPYPRQPVPDTEIAVSGAQLSLSPTQGAVGTRAALRAEGLPAGATLQLVWQTYVGNRVSGDGFEPQDQPIGPVTVGRDGRIDAPVAIPDDLGGLHGIALRDGTRTLGRAFFVIETSIVSMSPLSGPVGTPVTIHLKGVGWTEYDNIYIATYDNAYMGYACGFNSQGDVVINFTATGTPGPHIIDLYPGIYQGPPSESQLLYRQPQLTYADDHPGNRIPALRFIFEVTPALTSRFITDH